MRNILYIIIAVLAVVAVVLVFGVYQKQMALKKTSSPSSQTSSPSNTTAVASEADLFSKIPLAGSSEQERAKFNTEVKKFAKEALALEITDGTPSPLVFKVKPETVFNIKNNDKVAYQIDIGTGEIVTVPANDTISVKSGKGDGYYLQTDLVYINGQYKGFISISK